LSGGWPRNNLETLTLKFTILDVGHGSCAFLEAENSNIMMFDCGHKSDPEMRPSRYLREQGHGSVERLFISNYDQDHLSDLPRLRAELNIRSLHRNKSISAPDLRALKLRQAGEISAAMESMLDMIDDYTGGPLHPAPVFPGISYHTYHNNHPFGSGNDSNNISMVTFLTVSGTTILLPGDIERAGWLQLLENPDFADRLAAVNIFIASHHGRENGYCDEIFAHYGCRPDVFVFSDSPIQYATQEMTTAYARWANGIRFNGQRRSVLTTRNDGSLTWRF